MTLGVFGYGSLINRHTWAAPKPYARARLNGFVRQWRQRIAVDGQPVTSMAIARKEGSVIDGLVFVEDYASLPALDERERGYDRIDAGPHLEVVPGDTLEGIDVLAVPRVTYLTQTEHQHWASDEAPILHSYLDVIITGVRREFGEEGVARYVETTEGWDLPIWDDRAAPRYPRAVELSAAERDYIDGLLRELRKGG